MQFKLIMVFTNDDNTDKVLAASRQAGATSATIITNARGLGLKKNIGIWGLEIFNLQNLILILVESSQIEYTLEALKTAVSTNGKQSHDLVLQIDIERVVGLT